MTPLDELNGKIVLEGFVPIEEIERGFPKIKKGKSQHTLVILRSIERYINNYSREAVKITVTIERSVNYGVQAKENQDPAPVHQ